MNYLSFRGATLELFGSIFSTCTDYLTKQYFRAVKAMDAASPHLTNIQELLKNAIFIQQQIKYEQSRRFVMFFLSQLSVTVATLQE